MKQVAEIQLDDAVLERVASIICGNDDGLLYRRGFEIVKFFRAAGWSVPDEIDYSRYMWTVAQLQADPSDGAALARLVLRLADRREYLGEESAHRRVLDELNSVLVFEGYAVVSDQGRPRLVEIEQESPRMTAPIELTASLTQIVSDPQFGEQLRERLEEAHRCRESGSPTAAIVMLGSVLEGVLYDVAISRHVNGNPPTDHLESLINLAHDNRWIAKDVVDYAHVLRDHRNLVHPKKQWNKPTPRRTTRWPLRGGSSWPR